MSTRRWWSTNQANTPRWARSRKASPSGPAEEARDAPLAARVMATIAASLVRSSVRRGISTGRTPVRFPRWSESVPALPETGTETTSCVGSSPRLLNKPSKAPVTAASTTSLTVPPAAFAAATRSARGTSTVLSRRRPDVGRVSEVRPATRGCARAALSSLTPSRPRRSSAPRFVTRRARWRAASTASDRYGGRRCGNSRSSGSSPGSANARSTARPPRPSAITWCTTRTSALTRPPGEPATRYARHGGCSRGIRSQISSAARSSRCRSPGRSTTSRSTRCRSMANSASSTQIGAPHPIGSRCTR